MGTDFVSAGHAEVRENLVTTAVKFLSNPNVQRCTMESKERFLRNKGLTDIEIRKALEAAAEGLDLPSVTSELMVFRHARRSWFRENVLPLIVYGGVAYGFYWFYKNCLRNLLFVEEPRKKTTAELLEEIRRALDLLNTNITSLRSDVQSSHQSGEVMALRSQIDVVKCDIASVKGILLNRNQFPALKHPEPPSIPSWQRHGDAPGPQPEKPHRSRSQRSESGGSNSSEGEQATKNSDSSLEIIT